MTEEDRKSVSIDWPRGKLRVEKIIPTEHLRYSINYARVSPIAGGDRVLIDATDGRGMVRVRLQVEGGKIERDHFIHRAAIAHLNSGKARTSRIIFDRHGHLLADNGVAWMRCNQNEDGSPDGMKWPDFDAIEKETQRQLTGTKIRLSVALLAKVAAAIGQDHVQLEIGPDSSPIRVTAARPTEYDATGYMMGLSER